MVDHVCGTETAGVVHVLSPNNGNNVKPACAANWTAKAPTLPAAPRIRTV